MGVRGVVDRGAVVKRLSAVDTLGSTDVICTDKTGTPTENRMRATAAWTLAGAQDLAERPGASASPGTALGALAVTMAACNNASLEGGEARGDPTEAAMLAAAARAGR